MKKFFLSLIAILMIFSLISCDQLLSSLIKPPVEPPVKNENEENATPDNEQDDSSEKEDDEIIDGGNEDETPVIPEESIFDVAAKTCTVDVTEYYDFSTGTWDYQLLTSYIFELDPEVGPIGTIKEETVGYCYIFGTEEDSKVITVDTHGKYSLVCDSEEIYNSFK